MTADYLAEIMIDREQTDQVIQTLKNISDCIEITLDEKEVPTYSGLKDRYVIHTKRNGSNREASHAAAVAVRCIEELFQTGYIDEYDLHRREII